MARPTVQDTVDALNDLAARISILGIENVAEKAGLKPRIVRKFVSDVLVCKNSDIRKIVDAIKAMSPAN